MAENLEPKLAPMRISRDSLFKRLLRHRGAMTVLLLTFFGEAARQLDLSTLRFIDKEQPKRSRRESGQVMDLLAEAQLADGTGTARIHLEIENQ